MALDPVRLADTKEWLARAEDDLRAAKIDLAAKPPLIRDGDRMPWRARDVEMAVFQAERSGLRLPPLPPMDGD